MARQVNIVLFSEVNSKLGSPFLRVLSGHPLVRLSAIVTSPVGIDCSYFSNDETKVDLEVEANALGIPIIRPASVNDEESISFVKRASPDYIIVGNFQQKIKSQILSVPRKSILNFHPSPLPRYAGLAPFYWLIRNGERDSAISIIRMDEGLDTGPIVMQRPIRISNTDTALSLRTRQEEENVLMLLDIIPRLLNEEIRYTPQNILDRSYYGRPKADDYKIYPEFTAMTVQNYVRAGYRHPGASLKLKGKAPITVLSVALTNILDINIPLSPGRVIQIDRNIYLAVADQWLRILTIEENGQEVRATPDNIDVDLGHVGYMNERLPYYPRVCTRDLGLHP